MANVHRIGDYANNNPQQGGGRAPLLGNRQQPSTMPFYNTSRNEGDPRKEHFLQMCYLTCCPTLKLLSFTTLITIVDITLFIVTLVLGGIQSGPTSPFLQVNPFELNRFGSRIPDPNIAYNYQIWRFITPVFLHANFLHIFFNVFSQLIFGALVETMIGTFKMILVYFLCGIGGNLFGGLVSISDAVGASTAIVGLLGVFIAYIIVNWKRLDSTYKCLLICMVVIIVLMNVIFLFSETGNEIDSYGHFGGLITGVFSGMFFVIPMGAPPGGYEKKVKIVGIVVTIFYFVLCFPLFFLVSYPRNEAPLI